MIEAVCIFVAVVLTLTVCWVLDMHLGRIANALDAIAKNERDTLTTMQQIQAKRREPWEDIG